jgi:ATP-dependent protease ClpP protease subunit
MSRRIREAFDEVKKDVSVIVLDLNSPGGEIAEGARVIDILERIQRTHGVDTRVGFKRNCLSMCVPIFMEGENRIAAANARFMFHQPQLYDMVTEERVDVPEMEKRITTARFYRRYFEGSVMNEAWGEQLKIDWEDKDVWKTGRELVDEGSGLVTELE